MSPGRQNRQYTPKLSEALHAAQRAGLPLRGANSDGAHTAYSLTGKSERDYQQQKD